MPLLSSVLLILNALFILHRFQCPFVAFNSKYSSAKQFPYLPPEIEAPEVLTMNSGSSSLTAKGIGIEMS